MITEIDDSDRKLLLLLSNDSRVSLVKLSQSLNLTPVAVGNRIRKLEEEGIIRGYRPNIEYETLGFGYYKIFLNLSSGSSGSLTSVREYLSGQPQVLYIIEGIGLPADLDFEVAIQSPLELGIFMRKLRTAFPGVIADYSAMMFGKQLKLQHVPF